MSTGAAERSLAPYVTQRTERKARVQPLLDQLTQLGKRWGDARVWAAAETVAGRRAWKPADMPVQAPNADILSAYLEHLKTEEKEKTS